MPFNVNNASIRKVMPQARIGKEPVNKCTKRTQMCSDHPSLTKFTFRQLHVCC